MLAVCQGRTIYPADEEEEGWAAVRHALGSCSALGQVHDGQLYGGGKGISVCSGLYHIKPFVLCFKTVKTLGCRFAGSPCALWAGKQPCY